MLSSGRLPAYVQPWPMAALVAFGRAESGTATAIGAKVQCSRFDPKPVAQLREKVFPLNSRSPPNKGLTPVCHACPEALIHYVRIGKP